MPYRFRDDLTRADVAFEATGRDREELFRSAWQALLDLMLANAAALKKTTIKTSRLENDSLALLLIDFLNEALFFKDAAGLFLSIERLSIDGERPPFTLESTLAGEPVDRSRHELGTDVKAVTLHHFEFERTAAGFRATVVLDV
jgi:SHS2 domain-containing protein